MKFRHQLLVSQDQVEALIREAVEGTVKLNSGDLDTVRIGYVSSKGEVIDFDDVVISFDSSEKSKKTSG